MTAGTVLVLPSEGLAHWQARRDLLDAHRASIAVEPAPGPLEAMTARVCASINVAAPTGLLHLVAFGPAATMLPSVALSQRVARRQVAEYVLVDPDIPAVDDSWPDAPVTLFASDPHSPASRQARLRGWAVRPLTELADWVPVG